MIAIEQSSRWSTKLAWTIAVVCMLGSVGYSRWYDRVQYLRWISDRQQQLRFIGERIKSHYRSTTFDLRTTQDIVDLGVLSKGEFVYAEGIRGLKVTRQLRPLDADLPNLEYVLLVETYEPDPGEANVLYSTGRVVAVQHLAELLQEDDERRSINHPRSAILERQ